jgi:hypothetical protein
MGKVLKELKSFLVLIWHWAETQSSPGSAQPALSLKQPNIGPLTRSIDRGHIPCLFQ